MINASKIAFLFCLAAILAQAAIISIAFAQPAITLLTGQNTVAVSATLTNNDPANTVFLNSDNLSVPAAATIHDEFFTNVPFQLDPGQTSPLLELFTFTVAPNVLAGTVSGSYQLLGGVGLANQFNFDPLGTQTFTISTAPTPEPSTFLLVGAAVIALSLISKKRFPSTTHYKH